MTIKCSTNKVIGSYGSGEFSDHSAAPCCPLHAADGPKLKTDTNQLMTTIREYGNKKLILLYNTNNNNLTLININRWGHRMLEAERPLTELLHGGKWA